MNLAELVDHLIDMSPHDQTPSPDTDYETPRPPTEEDIEDSNTMKPKLLLEEESVRGNGLVHREEEPGEEPVTERDPRAKTLEEEESEEDPMEAENLEEDPEEGLLNEDDPEEDPIEEEDPEKDPKEEPLEEEEPDEEALVRKTQKGTQLRKNPGL